MEQPKPLNSLLFMIIRQTLSVLVTAFDAVKVSRIGKLTAGFVIGFGFSVGLFAMLSISEMMKASAVDGEVPVPKSCPSCEVVEATIPHLFPRLITDGGEVIDWDENCL